MFPELTERTCEGVTLLGDWRRPCGVSLAFSERMGGVSSVPYASLNLGAHVGDDLGAVEENRRRVLTAMGLSEFEDNLIVPNQVHGDNVCVIHSSESHELARVRDEVAQGCDAVVCVASDVPVLMCFADCVPVILVTPNGFAVIHSGWRGTMAKIAGKAARVLLSETASQPSEVLAYVGPHIGAEDYEVSKELLGRFVAEFGPRVRTHAQGNYLCLAEAIRSALEDEGITSDQILVSNLSTPSHTDKFYSYRAEAGTCGRHGAIAALVSPNGAMG